MLGEVWAIMSEFRSRRRGHKLQRNEKIDIMFRLVKLLAEDKRPIEYRRIKREWNEGK